MKQLHLIGTTGNNLTVIQVPTHWSINEVKEMFEKALLLFDEHSNLSEFLCSFNEQELDKKFPNKSSELIGLCKELINLFGTPITRGNGVIWQVEVYNFLNQNDDFRKKLTECVTKPITSEESAFICSNYLESLLMIVKSFRDY